MALGSPSVDVNELDQTNVVPATATSVAGYAGHFNWGPADEIVTVSSEKELIGNFGSPANGSTSRSFLTAASFLKYSNALRVSRAIGAGALNAADSNQVLIKNKDHFESVGSYNFVFASRYAGAIGNSITVKFAYVGGGLIADYEQWEYSNEFTTPPGKSLTASANGIDTNDEIHVVVIDTDGLISGTKGTILERFEGLSLGSNAKTETGATKYYKDVINETSSFIYVDSLSGTFAEADTAITANSVFAVEDAAVTNISTLALPFIQTVQTSVTYGSGDPIITSTTTDQTVTIESGYAGSIGNNAKINIRTLDSTATPAVAAHGFIKYNTPVDGDTIDINGTVFTKAAVGGVAEFSDITELEALIEAEANISASVIGDYIYIVADVAGVAGNAITLAFGENTGTSELSGATLTGGVEANSTDYLAVTVDTLSAVTGYVTYDITVGTSVVSNENTTTVTLGDIINETIIKSAIKNDADLQDLAFRIGETAVTAVSPEASIVFDLDSVVSYASGGSLGILPFVGGEIVLYNNDFLVTTLPLVGGADGQTAPSNVVTALDLFVDKDTVDINFLFAEAFDSDSDQAVVDLKVVDVANTRKDILAPIPAPVNLHTYTSTTDKKNKVITKTDSIASSSFITFTQTPVYTYNKYADEYAWIPENGHVAGLCANTDLVAEPWSSPAGFNRGQLKGVVKVAYNPTKTDRDDLYKKRINSIVSLPGEGTLLLGDKTGLSKPSAFDRINVRRLFNTIQRSIAIAAKYQLFELNDEFTRAAFKNSIEPYLRDVQGRRGIIEFRVVCDTTNNTGEVIDNNNFVGDIFVKPARSINNIQLNFIASRTGVEFKEIVGS